KVGRHEEPAGVFESIDAVLGIIELELGTEIAPLIARTRADIVAEAGGQHFRLAAAFGIEPPGIGAASPTRRAVGYGAGRKRETVGRPRLEVLDDVRVAQHRQAAARTEIEAAAVPRCVVDRRVVKRRITDDR